MLSTDIQSTLGGRYIPVEVYPYSFKEFLNANNIGYVKTPALSTEERAVIQRFFNAYFHFGGFPESATLGVKRNYLTSVYQKIFLGDIVVRNAVDNSFALKVMMKKLGESVKQPLSFTRIANIVASTGAKVGKKTVINYIEYAQDAWLITAIQNMAGKLADKMSNPKYYFTDNGLLNLFLSDGNTSLLENMVAVTLLRKYGREDAVFFYNRRVEVDFYIPDEALAVQACYSLTETPNTLEREVNALIRFSDVVKIKRMLIITRDEEKQIAVGEKTVEVIPVWKWLLEDVD